MKKRLFLLGFTLFLVPLFAQEDDSLQKNPTVIIEVYDVVGVYESHSDGRGNPREFTIERKGEILNYDQSTGLLTFKTLDGKIHAYKPHEYKYFEYDKAFKKKIKNHVVKERKTNGFVFSAGFSSGYINITDQFIADAIYLNGWGSSANIPLSIKVGVQKCITEQMQLGITADYALLNSDRNYLTIGPRFQYLYNTKKNAAFYFPAELKYSLYQMNMQYVTNDTTYLDNSSWEFPSRMDADITLHALELNVGQGVSFALKNKKSLSLELMLIKQFMMSQKIVLEKPQSPNTKIGVTGIKLALFMNF